MQFVNNFVLTFIIIVLLSCNVSPYVGEQSRRAVYGFIPGRGAELVGFRLPEELQQYRDPDQEEQVFL